MEGGGELANGPPPLDSSRVFLCPLKTRWAQPTQLSQSDSNRSWGYSGSNRDALWASSFEDDASTNSAISPRKPRSGAG